MIKLVVLLSLLISSTCVAKTLRISIVDTGLNLKDPRFSYLLCDGGKTSKDFTGTDITDTNSHGTHVAGLIKQYAGNSDYCLIILKYYVDNANSFDDIIRLELSFNEAVKLKSDIVNYSGGGISDSTVEKAIISEAEKTLFVVSAGNDRKYIDCRKFTFYPACYHLPNVLVVGSVNSNNEISQFSNFGPIVTVWEIGENVLSTLPNGRYGILSGSSQSTAVRTGKLIYEKSHY